MTKQNRCNREVASPVPCRRNGYKPWTDDEIRYLKRHRTDGAELIAHVLGRSVSSVKAKAFVLKVSLMYVVGDICPVCGVNPIRAEAKNASSHGMCQVCWERRKADAMRERAAERAAQRDYDNAKHRKNTGCA